MKNMNIAIIGGGASGFFSAIAIKENYPEAKVVIFEKSEKVLSKVKVSGGGRCNLTNNCNSASRLLKAYPRGSKGLKKVFRIFNVNDTMKWFEERGVPLVIQDDNCVFPVSQDSQSIIDCFLREVKRLDIKIISRLKILNIKELENGLELKFDDKYTKSEIFNKVIVTTGGSPEKNGLKWLEKLNHKIKDPVPSLFTFNMPNETITKLMGIVVENTQVGIQGTKLKAEGILLITHWGMSGPAILKLSAFGARVLNEMQYKFKVRVNWVNENNNDIVLELLNNLIEKYPKKILSNIRPYYIPERLWLFLLEKCEIQADKKWSELGKKNLNKIVNILTNDIFEVKGKTKFRDEFVTCGGVSLESVDMNTMQSKVLKNLYFAGEVLDIDGITGGYNLQAAWSTGFLSGKLRSSTCFMG